MAKLVWRVKLIAELGSGIVSETEVARIERDDFAVAETVGLTLDEGKRLTAATRAEIVRAQVTTMGERFRWCEHCGAKLSSKGYYPATFRSAFGDVGVRIRRLHACSCRPGPRAEELSGVARHWRYRARAGLDHGEICRTRAIRPGRSSAVRTPPDWRCNERQHRAKSYRARRRDGSKAHPARHANA